MKKLFAFFAAAMAAALVLTACSTLGDSGETKSYSAVEEGFHGDVTAVLYIKDGKLVDVKVSGPGETPDIGGMAIEQLPKKMIAANSVKVDGLTGATFTSNAILKAAGAALEKSGVTLKPSSAGQTEEAKTYTADVIVVGGGLAGLTAANSALQNNAKVVVLEKLPATGGNAKSSLGSFMVAEVDENRQFQVSGEIDNLRAALGRWKQYQDTYSYRKNARYPDYSRLSYMLVQTMYTVDWLKKLGATFEPKTPISDRGMAMLQVNVPNINLSSGAAQLLAHLEKLVLDNPNATLLLETPAYALIMDGNKATGVRAKSSGGGEVTVYGKSVILACGSYTQNEATMNEYIPDIGEVDVWAVASDTGDGIKMALDVGAVLWGEDFIHPAPPNISNAFKAINPSRGNVPSFYNTLLVDKDGKRIMNEADSSYARQVLKMAELQSGPYWALHDNARLSAAQREMLEKGLATTGVLKGDTLDALAEKAGLKKAVFQAAFTRYNQLASAGDDKDFGKPKSNLLAYGTAGPYYLVRMIPCACDVLGGIVTNQDYRILNAQGKPFDSLWAAGSMSNGVYYNQYYFSGSSLTFASTSGRLTGKQAAENAK